MSIIEITPQTFNPSKAWRPQFPMTEMGKIERIAARLDVDLIQVAGTYQVMIATTWQSYCTLVGTAAYIARKIHADERIVRALLNDFWRETEPGAWINPDLSTAARKMIEKSNEKRGMRDAKASKRAVVGSRKDQRNQRSPSRTKNQEPTSKNYPDTQSVSGSAPSPSSQPNPDTSEVTRTSRRVTGHACLMTLDWKPGNREREIAARFGFTQPDSIEKLTQGFVAHWIGKHQRHNWTNKWRSWCKIEREQLNRSGSPIDGIERGKIGDNPFRRRGRAVVGVQPIRTMVN